MDYKNSEMKIDQLISYLNESKINLSPAFQRGHVWKLNLRRKLLKNIIEKKPIPAIFLYKEASGAKYSYNILDGKQRIESIILYVGNSREDLTIPRWKDYFLQASKQRDHADFSADRKNPLLSFQNLNESVVRDFREYSIPTIEIALDEDTSSLNEIISLFIDINQQGVPVSRFNIVKALCLDSVLLKSVFSLIAQKQRRGNDLFYKMIDNDITRVVKKLRDVQAVPDHNFKVDKIWEHLLEVVLFCQTGQHRKPIDILKGFINNKAFAETTVTSHTIKIVRATFHILAVVSRKVGGGVTSPFFTDYTYFYTIATSLTKPGILTNSNQTEIEEKLINLANALVLQPKHQPASIKKLLTLSKLHTTDVSNRQQREQEFLRILRSPAKNLVGR